MRKLVLLFLLVILLPLIIFSVYEIGNLRQNERIIEDIYMNQLDALLFSVNQYSNDIVSSTAGRIEEGLEANMNDSGAFVRLFSEMPALIGFAIYDSMNRLVLVKSESDQVAKLTRQIEGVLEDSAHSINRLKTYLKSGYRKIESLGSLNGNIQAVAFACTTGVSDGAVVMFLHADVFIEQVLDPKMQEIARGKFRIAVFRPGEDTAFYTSERESEITSIDDTRPFWLFPEYRMGIELIGVTLSDLARDRIRRNLALIGIMDAVLLIGAWLIFRNIRRQLELSQLKSDFVSNVSHEIRTPLALISMYIETLEMGRIREEPKVKEYYSVILNETARLSSMVNRILSFSQMEGNRRRYTFGATHLNEIAEQIIQTYKYTLENKGFSLSFEPDPEIPDITADREAVADALSNLVDNAMKYSADSKFIRIQTGVRNGGAFVSVADKGIGISSKDQKFIFDKFFRVTEKNLANRVKGSGLGLAIVKHIVLAHKGRVDVVSAPGQGSVFSLWFPINKSHS